MPQSDIGFPDGCHGVSHSRFFCRDPSASTGFQLEKYNSYVQEWCCSGLGVWLEMVSGIITVSVVTPIGSGTVSTML